MRFSLLSLDCSSLSLTWARVSRIWMTRFVGRARLISDLGGEIELLLRSATVTALEPGSICISKRLRHGLTGRGKADLVASGRGLRPALRRGTTDDHPLEGWRAWIA